MFIMGFEYHLCRETLDSWVTIESGSPSVSYSVDLHSLEIPKTICVSYKDCEPPQ